VASNDSSCPPRNRITNPSTRSPPHVPGGKAIVPSTLDSIGATRIAPAGSSTSRSMRLRAACARRAEASPSCLVTGRSPMRKRMSVPAGVVTRTSPARIARSKARCRAARAV
jgi:hypothetical protein